MNVWARAAIVLQDAAVSERSRPVPSQTGERADAPAREADLAIFANVATFKPTQIQRVLTAVAGLQTQRNRLAHAVGRESLPHTRITATGALEINRWLFEEAPRWKDMLSVRPWGRVEELRVTLPRNRRFVADGNRMVSVFDYQGTTPQARLLLSAEKSGRYLFAYAPLQIKIADNRRVVLDGPVVDGEPSIMLTSEPTILAAAHAYWRAVLDSSFPCSEAPERVAHLTDRQRQVMAFLSTDISDEQIAAAIGVSVRTVRADIARVMALLGVRSRFSLGQALKDRLQD